MKIVVLGATGRTGRVLVQQALSRGHSVTAIVRDPTRLQPAAHLEITTAEVTNARELSPVFKGHDAVLATLGNNHARVHLLERSTNAVIAAMYENNIQRVIFELAFGAASRIHLSPVVKSMMQLALGGMLNDQIAGVGLLKSTRLDWTIVYATILTNSRGTGNARLVRDNETVGARHKIAREDVAQFMLEVLESHSFSRAEAVISG